MTPMLRQYLKLKEQAGSALLLYRMGDFYELFFEDAQVAAPVLGITLTRRRQNDSVEAPMCGVPHHAFDGYLAKLLGAGFRVAVAEQVEDPAEAKGLIRREIIRTHTPGTISDTEILDGSEHCFLAACGGYDDAFTLAWIEVSTGAFEGIRCSNQQSLTEHLARLRPRELLVAEDWDGWQSLWPPELPKPVLTPVPAESFSPSAGELRLRRVLEVSSLRGFGLEAGEALVGMAGALLGYVENTQRGALNHVGAFVCRDGGDALEIDRASLRNLEIERTVDGGRSGSLVDVLDHTLTRMGSRLLCDRLVRPSVDLEEIDHRHRAVAELVDDTELVVGLREAMAKAPDLERLAARVGLALATPRELQSLRAGLDLLPGVKEVVRNATSSRLRRLGDDLDPMTDLASILHTRLAAEPAQVAGQGTIAGGWDAELDEQRSLARGGKELLAGIESRERERTGINSLKVRYNRVFGYYIEISKSNLDRVPEDYERRQTLTNAERFVTPELKELEGRILSAEERATSRDRELYQELVDGLSSHAQRVSAAAEAVARFDVLAAFADRARRWNYCRPVMVEEPGLSIREGRHPVLEELQRDPPFIPNDCNLDPNSSQIVLLTGPNMGGKSTYLRQNALITLLAHAGSFVPAAEAIIGLTDRIFTRVGASDMLARGESTFMVEMTETANILNHANQRSLVILDEVGRGTATFDGLSLAWAIVEFLHDREDHAALVLFATHYHELTDLGGMLPRLVNRSMAVKEWRGSILFLHRVTDGRADRSYGIHVARLAGVPDGVCDRAEQILANLERHELNVTGDPVMQAPPDSDAERIRQLALFRSPVEEVADRLRRLQPDTMTPLEALSFLAELRAKVERED
ncbi:MAG: DNA mismatch repair protein MutS [Thermoanaerobaculales bacterium]